jgi:hypothetical protein
MASRRSSQLSYSRAGADSSLLMGLCECTRGDDLSPLLGEAVPSRPYPVVEVAAVQMAVIVIVVPLMPEKPVADQPLRSVVGPLSLT